MNAQELTKQFYQMSNDLIELKKAVQYLEMENEKLRLRLSDLEIDVRMTGGSTNENHV